METSPDFWAVQILIGLSFGLLLFLLAAGFSLIFGLMRFVNLAHGSLFMIGAYLATSLSPRFQSFALALLVVMLLVAAIGAGIYLLFSIGGERYRGNILWQVLLTLGLLFIFADAIQWGWEGLPRATAIPAAIDHSITIGNSAFPVVRFVLMAISLVVAGLLWLMQDRSKFGALVRAGVDDQEMLSGLGVNTTLLFLAVFLLGTALAGLAGGLGSLFLGAYPGQDLEVQLFALVIVILGGLGSLKGAFIASIAIGITNSIGTALIPEFAIFTIFALVVVTLSWRPTGLFGRV